MEWWNTGMLVLKRSLLFTDHGIKKDLTNKPLSQHSKPQYSILPVFHHSNWGEALGAVLHSGAFLKAPE